MVLDTLQKSPTASVEVAMDKFIAAVVVRRSTRAVFVEVETPLAAVKLLFVEAMVRAMLRCTVVPAFPDGRDRGAKSE